MTDNAFLIKTRYAVSADVHISTFFLILLHWLVFYVVYDFKFFWCCCGWWWSCCYLDVCCCREITAMSLWRWHPYMFPLTRD